MLYNHFMRLLQNLSAAIEDGWLVIASSPRAARALRRTYAEEQRKSGFSAWRSPAITHWDGWLESVWQQRLRTGDESRFVLSALQESELWVRLIRPEIEDRSLISIEGVADLAQQAYSLLCDYDALGALREDWPNSDARSFSAWARSFESECREQGWISRSKLPLIFGELARSRAAAREIGARRDPDDAPLFPPRIALVGFDRIAPAQERLLTALEQGGSEIGYWGSSSQPEPGEAQSSGVIEALVEASDSLDEVSVCAWWAKRTMELAAELAATADQKPRIGILVPDLAARRGEIARVFRRILAPESVAVTAPEQPLPFEFSLGVSLARAPMARAALLLLRWMEKPLGREELTWLMLSGFFWQQQSDWLSVSAFDAEIRGDEVLPPTYALDLYLRQSGWHGSTALSGLRDRLFAARREWHAANRSARGFADWAEAAQRILAEAGWPGAHTMQSEDFQLKSRWDRLLDGVAQLSFDGRAARYEDFLRVLERQAEQAIYSPESRYAPVQILGPLEAAGLEFDAVWFLGASESGWPAPARPHPLLPTRLQRERGMPHAAPGADWELARAVTARIQNSARRSIFSYPLQEKDGPGRPSTVLTPRPPVLSSARMRENLAVPHEEQPVSLLQLDDDQTAGAPWPREREAGGYSVLKMQAACPFQAFAHYRLHARPLEQTDWGLDPKDRGKVLHHALEGLWSELENRDALLDATRAGSLQEMIGRWTDRALERYRFSRRAPKDGTGDAQQGEESWRAAYLLAERTRIVGLLEEWLAYEAKRPRFSVEGRETPIDANVGELKLKLRADRIDRIDGGQLLIDYKTGEVSTNDWEGGRPDEPQLPLYALFGNVENLRGVLLAQIRAEKLKFAGRVEEAVLPAVSGLPGSAVEPYTPELHSQWETALRALAEDFLQGEASVDPKSYPQSCQYCPLPPLCRIGESARARAALDNESAGIDTGNGERGNGD